MMSPLSVAHYLKPESVRFDMLVMDEASQIRPEEALGAIARAAQVIVVGDPNQLPPTSFFERSIEAADDDEGDEETGAAFSGTQSILEVANQFYPTRYLKWHYRSHHQSLIAFSNARFYDGRLIVFPSPSDRNPQLGVTYHYIEGATYSSRQNLTEAVRVVDATLEHVALHPDLSLGVATLNLTQRNLIEELLEQRVRGDKSWTTYCAQWEQKGLPFFVKNLENVQGDERDVIFVSTTFGPALGTTRVFQRFGPICTPTGWRRLNVLFTRARIALHVYSSLRPEDIVVDENTRRGTAEFRNYLEYARDGKIGPATITDREPDSDFEVAV
ncbi:MAG: DEAD/DEAH box helicase, partial [Fibrobacterota bacterium]